MLTQGVINEFFPVTSLKYKLWISFFFMLYEMVNILSLKTKGSSSKIHYFIGIVSIFFVFILFGLFI